MAAMNIENGEVYDRKDSKGERLCAKMSEHEGDRDMRDVDYKDRLARIEWKVDQMCALIAKALGDRVDGMAERVGAGAGVQDAVSVLGKFTTKQHAAMQMLVTGASNAEIADRFGVTENTAKVYVRSLAGKLGVNSRMQIVLTVVPMLEVVDERTYETMSGGLPLDWASKYDERGQPDKWESLYRYEKEGE